MEDPRVTIVVTPRERFSAALRSLDSLLAHTSCPHRLVYVDAGSPPGVRRGIAARGRTHGFEHLRIGRSLYPNQSRNLGLERARTPYVVFVDNDLLFRPGWLEALLACAEQTGAAIVGPLLLEGEFEQAIVHQAGGEAHFEATRAGRVIVESRRHHGEDPGRLRDELQREETEQIEFHCMLVRRALFERTGLLDETYTTVMEYTDLCLKARASGQRVFFEPASVVSYLNPEGLALSDLPYFWKRWGRRATRTTVEHFRRAWDLAPGGGGLEPVLGFVEFQRRLPRRQLGAALRRLAAGALFAKPAAELAQRPQEDAASGTRR